MFILYNIAYLITGFFYLPYMCLAGKGHRDFGMRFGFYRKALKESLATKENIWVHAVSVGEVLSVRGIVRQLKERFPQKQIVLSTVTKTGYQVAKSEGGVGDIVIYAPLDFSWVVRKILKLIRPQIYILAETELWPNLLQGLQRRKVPVVQINGRISDRSFKGYRRIRFFIKRAIARMDHFCMQSEMDTKRIIALGADPSRVENVGNIKFDELSHDASQELPCFEVPKNTLLFVAGSTHPGEEEIILGVFKNLLNEFPHLRLVLAPRHIERAEEIARLVAQYGFDPLRLTSIWNKKFEQGHVVLVDTMGHLKRIYRMASVVFVGKSLTVGGGHNIIEPAFFEKPTLIGPLMANFRDITDLFAKNHAIIQVQNADDMQKELKKLLSNESLRKQIGKKAKGVVADNAGATSRTVNAISRLLTHA